MSKNQIDIQGVSGAKGLNNDERSLLSKLLAVYNQKQGSNYLQWQYYRDKHSAPNLGISVPDKFANLLNTSIGWAAKAVDMLAERSIFDSFVIAGDSSETLDKIVLENDFKLMYEMAVPSELVHSCGFWTVTANSDKNNKVPVIRYYNAQNAAAIWDFDKRRIKAGFCITDYDYDNNGVAKASHIVLHTDTKVVEVVRKNFGGWELYKRSNNKMGRPLMEAMCYMPSDSRPFGKSRITKAVMGITDEMQREILRMAITSELFSAPMRYMFGVSEESFLTDKERLYWDKFVIAERDEDGKVPEMGQLRQASMTPHIDVMRNLASRMAAEASIPVNSLGIIHDNPSSAEALRASMEDLCILAETLNRNNNRALRNIAKLALAVHDNKTFDDLTDDEKNVSVCFKNPYTPSIASQTDAMIKQASMATWLPETEIYWEMLGYNDEQRSILMRSKEKAQAEQYMLQNVPSIQNANQMYPNTPPEQTLEEQAQEEEANKQQQVQSIKEQQNQTEKKEFKE